MGYNERTVFTGIIRAQATIEDVRPRGQGIQIVVCPVPVAWDQGEGDSIAVDGVCLTVEQVDGERVRFYVSQETLAVTTARHWRPGRSVHMEPAVAVGERLDGHIVQGHVDATGAVADAEPVGEDLVVWFSFPETVAPMIFDKGSIAVDGVSLTVNHVDGDRFSVNLIPHTRKHTHLGDLPPGEPVNLETDPVARQVVAIVERMKELQRL